MVHCNIFNSTDISSTGLVVFISRSPTRRVKLCCGTLEYTQYIKTSRFGAVSGCPDILYYVP